MLEGSTSSPGYLPFRFLSFDSIMLLNTRVKLVVLYITNIYGQHVQYKLTVHNLCRRHILKISNDK